MDSDLHVPWERHELAVPAGKSIIDVLSGAPSVLSVPYGHEREFHVRAEETTFDVVAGGRNG